MTPTSHPLRPVLASLGFTPTAGMEVTAWVGGNLRGQADTTQVEEHVTYSIDVFADGPRGAAGCGMPGTMIRFYVGSQPLGPTTPWNESRVWGLPLTPVQRMYSPLIFQNR